MKSLSMRALIFVQLKGVLMNSMRNVRVHEKNTQNNVHRNCDGFVYRLGGDLRRGD